MYRNSCLILGVVIIATVLQGLSLAGHDGEAGFDPLSVPNPALAAYYAKNQSEIEKLSSTAKDTAADEQQRLDALTKLKRKFPDPAARIAIDLVNDKSAALAASAAKILANAAVMTDHKMTSSGQMSPYAKYQMAKDSSVRNALRAAAVDKREEVRQPAAELLSAQSDAKGLAAIATAAKEGVYSDVEAVGYLKLADPSKSGPYLSPYLEKGSDEVRALAAGRLSYAPEYRAVVRDKVLLNPDAKLTVREAAAKGLASDPDVALPIIVDKTTPSKLRAAVLEGYVKSRGGRSSAEQIKSLQQAVEDLQKEPGIDLQNVKADLQRQYEQKSK